jgi:hypothetical protein
MPCPPVLVSYSINAAPMTMHRTASHGAVVGCHLFFFYLLVTYGKPSSQRPEMLVMGLGGVVGAISAPGSWLKLPRPPTKVDEGTGAEAGAEGGF